MKDNCHSKQLYTYSCTLWHPHTAVTFELVCKKWASQPTKQVEEAEKVHGTNIVVYYP